MKRAEVAHLVRAAQEITKEREFVLVGSQAALLAIDHLPQVMEQSGELDIYPLRQPDLADLIDGAIGEGSSFHATYGYYAQGVAPETAKLPRNWRDRAVRMSPPPMNGAIAIAPEIHDLCASKAIAYRKKDRDYIRAAITARIINPELLHARVGTIDGVDTAVIRVAQTWLRQFFRQRDR